MQSIINESSWRFWFSNDIKIKITRNILYIEYLLASLKRKKLWIYHTKLMQLHDKLMEI